MSIILDALKKSESDQQRQSGPALFEVRVAPPKARFPVWAIAIVALLVINMLIVGYLLLRRTSHGDESAAANPGSGQFNGQNGAAFNNGAGGGSYNGANRGAGYPNGFNGNGMAPNGGQGVNTTGTPYGANASGGPNGGGNWAQNQGAGSNGPQGQGGGAYQGMGPNSFAGQGQGRNGFGGQGGANWGAAQGGPNGGGPMESNGSGNMGGQAGNINAPGAVEPTLANRARQAMGAESGQTGNPDDYAPANDPQSPLFKGHVKRGTDSGVPLYQDMAVVPGVSLPELRLDLHVYAANPADRFALINMKKMHEGDSPAQGVRVESITPDGVILSQNGSKFLLPRE